MQFRRPHFPRDPDIREIFDLAGLALPGTYADPCLLLFPGPSFQEFLAFMHAGGSGKQDNDGSSSDSSTDSSSSVGPSMACMFEFQSGLSRTHAEAKDSESECGQKAAENKKDERSKLDQIQQVKHEEPYVSPASSAGLPRTRACIHVRMILHGRVKLFTCHMSSSWLQTLLRSCGVRGPSVRTPPPRGARRQVAGNLLSSHPCIQSVHVPPEDCLRMTRPVVRRLLGHCPSRRTQRY